MNSFSLRLPEGFDDSGKCHKVSMYIVYIYVYMYVCVCESDTLCQISLLAAKSVC